MENCPPEILSRIFVLTCTDGGYMGGVLRLVSKRISAQAKPFRFWSVCVNGVDRIERFEKTILKVGAAQRRVQHLFISDKTGFTFDFQGQKISRGFGTTQEDELSQREDLYSGSQRLTIAERAKRNAYNEEANRFTAAFGRLLGYLRTHLKSLTLLLYNIQCNRWLVDLRSRTFPRLTDVAFWCKSPRTTIPPDMYGMPLLRSLTIGPHGGIWLSCVSIFLRSCDDLNLIDIQGLVCDEGTPAMIRKIIRSKNDFVAARSKSNRKDGEASQGSLPPSEPALRVRICDVSATPFLPAGLSKEALFRDIVKAGAKLIPQRSERGPTFHLLRDAWISELSEKADEIATA